MKFKFDKIQPSQLYISEEKFKKVWESFDKESYEPVPIKELDGEIIFTDGHTRALVAYLKGLEEIEVFWEDEELDWDLYRICVRWCKEAGITKIGDLKDRIIPDAQYQIFWLERCKREEEKLRNDKKCRDRACPCPL